MKLPLLIIFFLFSIVSISCGQEPEPINFGSDDCAHCKMTIMDSKFGAELVTKKGKVYKFDAAECLINFLKKGKVREDEVKHFLVVDFNHPGNLINSLNSYYLISQNLQSPMGANLSCFENKNSAEAQKNEFGGEVYDWNGLEDKLK